MFPMPENNFFGSLSSNFEGLVGCFNSVNDNPDQPISIGSFSTDGANWDPTNWSPIVYPSITIPYPSTTVPYTPPITITVPDINLFPSGQEGLIPGMDSEVEIVVLPKDPMKKRNALRELLKEEKPVEEEQEGRRIDLGEE